MSEHLAEIYGRFGSSLLEAQQEHLEEQIAELEAKRDLIAQELARRATQS